MHCVVVWARSCRENFFITRLQYGLDYMETGELTKSSGVIYYQLLCSDDKYLSDRRAIFFHCLQYPSFIIWLAPRAGKMNQTARCDWLPERARWSDLARSGLPAASRKQNFTKSHIINPLLTKFVRSRWLDIGLVLFACLWTSTSSRSINTQKKNLANIQPSWPDTWSITHT